MISPLRIALLAALALGAAPLAMAAPDPAPQSATETASVSEDSGTIVYRAGARTIRLPGSGHDSMPAVSPDGRLAVVVRDGIPKKGHEATIPTELWLYTVGADAPAPARRLLGERRSEVSEKTQTGFNNPTFSNDSATVYVLGHAWVTSDVVLAVNVATGKAHFVVDGNSVRVVRTGPYSGDLLVSRHKYHGADTGGSYDPVDLVTPAGKLILTIPGSADDENDTAVDSWLEAHHWTAS